MNVQGSIVQLSEHVLVAVEEADWDRVVELLVDRRAVLEQAFAEMPDDEQQIADLRALAEQVINHDRELIAAAQDARRETIKELRQLQAGQKATNAYQDNAR